MNTAASRVCRLSRGIRSNPILPPLLGSRRYSQDSPSPQSTLDLPRLSRTQLLRYALTGSITGRTSHDGDKMVQTRLEELFSRRQLPKRLGKASPSSPQRPVEFEFRSETVVPLSRIQDEIQMKVTGQQSWDHLVDSFSALRDGFSQCENQTQWEDLLSTINGTLARLGKLNVTNTKDLLLLGMNYASQCFHVSALRHYFQQFSARGFGLLSPETAHTLISNLSQSLDMRLMSDRTLDMNQMRQLITHHDTQGPVPGTLRSLIDTSNPFEHSFMGLYAKLLGQLGDQKGLLEVWPTIREELVKTPVISPILSDAAANCLEALIKSGNSQAAIEAVLDISNHLDLNPLLPIHLWTLLLECDNERALRQLIKEKTASTILDGELRSLELAMGIGWSSEGRGHYKTLEFPIWCNKGSPEEAYELLGVDDTAPPLAPGHILELLKNTNSPKSPTRLATIDDLLHEYEGLEVPLGTTQDTQPGEIELSWVMQSSPIEVSQDSDQAGEQVHYPQHSSSLGLLRVRQDCNGVPRKIGPHLHLMQLGYVVMRRKPTSNLSNTPTARNPERWSPTGHIVSWDRRHGGLVLLWVGKGYGALDAGVLHPQVPPYLQYLCAEVRNLEALEQNAGFDVQSLGLVERYKDTLDFWVDVDPGHDLKV